MAEPNTPLCRNQVVIADGRFSWAVSQNSFSIFDNLTGQMIETTTEGIEGKLDIPEWIPEGEEED